MVHNYYLYQIILRHHLAHYINAIGTFPTADNIHASYQISERYRSSITNISEVVDNITLNG